MKGTRLLAAVVLCAFAPAWCADPDPPARAALLKDIERLELKLRAGHGAPEDLAAVLAGLEALRSPAAAVHAAGAAPSGSGEEGFSRLLDAALGLARRAVQGDGEGRRLLPEALAALRQGEALPQGGGPGPLRTAAAAGTLSRLEERLGRLGWSPPREPPAAPSRAASEGALPPGAGAEGGARANGQEELRALAGRLLDASAPEAERLAALKALMERKALSPDPVRTLLSDPSPRIVVAALGAAELLNARVLASDVGKLLRTKGPPEVRERAYAALRSFDEESYLAELLLDSGQEPGLRRDALKRMVSKGFLGPERALGRADLVGLLHGLLDPVGVELAAEALASYLPEEELARLLWEKVESSGPIDRPLRLETLARQGLRSKAARERVARLLDGRGAAPPGKVLKAISRIGAAAEYAPEAARVLDRDDPALLVPALELLGAARAAAYKEKVLAVLARRKAKGSWNAESPDFAIRLAALNALDAMGAAEFTPEEAGRLREGRNRTVLGAVRALLALQDKAEGRWPGPAQYAARRETVNADLATSALAVEALRKVLPLAADIGLKREEIGALEKARAQGEAYLLDNGTCGPSLGFCGLQVFRYAYVLEALAHGTSWGSGKKSGAKMAAGVLKDLEALQESDGTFKYAENDDGKTFLTAVAMLALLEVKDKGGLGSAEPMLQRAAAGLAAMKKKDGSFMYNPNLPDFATSKAAAAGRDVLCEYALYRYQRSLGRAADKSKLEEALKSFMKRHRAVENVSRAEQSQVHSTPDQISDYFYLFGVRYAALALREASFPEKEQFARELELRLLAGQPAGQWTDGRFTQGASGIALGLLALLDAPAGK